jgi:DNA repair protein RadD
VYRHLREKDTNPCVVIPTAGGKSLCIAEVAKDAVKKWNGRVMILAHVKELVEQNAAKLKGICPELPVGVYSAGLDSRETDAPVIVAGIQSVYNKIDCFQPFDLVMIDEVHMVPPDGEGRYRTFLEAAKRVNPRVRLVGWTATPYRTQGGLICKPENLLNEVCYEIGVKELINRGYISNITAKAGRVKADTEGLHIRAGEFVAEDVEKLMGEDRLVMSACHEIVELTKDRQACLVFCTSVAHCKKVAAQIAKLSGEECAIVTGDTPDLERAETIRRLRGESVTTDLFGTTAGPLKYCCNVSVLTTGTDIPRLDTIALLRPTNSPGLLVQMVGRGFRLSPETGKTECLVLDYGRNIERHGPIDMIKVREPGQGGGGPLAKECPECRTIVNLSVMLCPTCGHQWPRKEPERQSHEATAAKAAILSGEVTVEKFPVMHTDYQVWEKRGAPPGSPRTVRVTYDVDYLTHYSEWLCPEHTGYARRKFEKWWREHAHPDCPMPRTAEEVCEHAFAGMLREVKVITVRFVSGQKYPEITGCETGDFPLVASGESTQGEEDWDDIPF